MDYTVILGTVDLWAGQIIILSDFTHIDSYYEITDFLIYSLFLNKVMNEYDFCDCDVGILSLNIFIN